MLVQQEGGQIFGIQRGQGTESPILDAKLQGNQFQWVNQVTKPFKLKVKFNGIIEGNVMTGKCKAGIMGTYPFSAVKQS